MDLLKNVKVSTLWTSTVASVGSTGNGGSSASFGAKLTAPGTGIILNNSVASFSRFGPNQPAPGRRTTSSMAPTLVLDGNQVVMVLGKAGRARTATDAAPMSMFESVAILKPEEESRPGVDYDSLVAEMDAVEVAEREDAGPKGLGRLGGVGPAVHGHHSTNSPGQTRRGCAP